MLFAVYALNSLECNLCTSTVDALYETLNENSDSIGDLLENLCFAFDDGSEAQAHCN